MTHPESHTTTWHKNPELQKHFANAASYRAWMGRNEHKLPPTPNTNNIIRLRKKQQEAKK